MSLNSVFLSDLVGCEDEMLKITASWIEGERTLPLNPILIGPPGVGKNRLVYEIARNSGKELYILHGQKINIPEEIVCGMTVDHKDRNKNLLCSFSTCNGYDSWGNLPD